ncbi:MAG: hypothetical protein GXP61_11375 [Epsilonproteobacteria bacterium]|nr:hypothetical protein [Campylobacterota bacterium]
MLTNIGTFFLLLLFIFESNLYSTVDTKNSIIVNSNQFKLYKNNETQSLKLPTKKGDYATASIFGDKSELDWSKKFNVVEFGGIDDEHITYQLLKRKKVLKIPYRIAYDWMPAFYYYINGGNSNFVKWLYKNKTQRTLNPNGPYLHCDENHYNWCKDYYYNLGNNNVFRHKINNLLNNIKNRGFNGLFFDWASGGYILQNEYKSIFNYYKKLNPHKNYFKIIGNFYKKLKKLNILVITNQAFRKDNFLLPFVDYDMTESYITTDKNIKKKIQILGKGWVENIPITNYYPIHSNSHSLKDSLHFINLLTAYKRKYKKYGFKNFIYMNYLAPEYRKIYKALPLYKMVKPKNGIYFSYAMAKLTNNFVYAEVPYNRKLEKDDVYFYNLGLPLGKNYIKLNAIKGYVRFYKNGFVLVSNAYKKDVYLKVISSYLPKNRFIYDAYDHTWLKSYKNSIIIKLHFQKNTFSKKSLPIGRVFIYVK